MKNFLKLFGIIALVAVIGFSMAGCDFLFKTDNGGNDGGGDGSGNDGGSSGGGSGVLKPAITVKNSTGYSLGSIYFKPSTEVKNWGTNYVGWWDLEDGKSGDYTLEKSISDCSVYDIRSSGGNYNFIKYKVTVSNKMTITFTTSDLDTMSNLPKITIQNRTGKYFDSINIKLPSSTDWGDSFGGISNNSDKSDINILIPPTNYTVFDIQAKSSNPTSTYTKSNVTISNGMTILFTNTDRENSTIEDPVIVIQNNTGYSVAVYIRSSSPGSDAWGSSSTGWWDLEGGKSQAFSAPKGNIDIKLTGGNFTFIKEGIQAVDGQIYTFTTADKVNNP